ncbi:hypothetical protein [Streptomyces sp. NPDC057702]|uniref:hypothetical protein n=1 Tax=unclassified Streptomyces TaxID=2593676 RepID=UPI0036B46A4A
MANNGAGAASESGYALLIAAGPTGRQRAMDTAAALPPLAAVAPTVLLGVTGGAQVVQLVDPDEPHTVLTHLRTAAAHPGPVLVYLVGQLTLDAKQHLPHLALARTTPKTARYTALPWHWLLSELGHRPAGATTVFADLAADEAAWPRLTVAHLATGLALYGCVAPPPRRRQLNTPHYTRALAATLRAVASRPPLAQLHQHAAEQAGLDQGRTLLLASEEGGSAAPDLGSLAALPPVPREAATPTDPTWPTDGTAPAVGTHAWAPPGAPPVPGAPGTGLPPVPGFPMATPAPRSPLPAPPTHQTHLAIAEAPAPSVGGSVSPPSVPGPGTEPDATPAPTPAPHQDHVASESAGSPGVPPETAPETAGDVPVPSASPAPSTETADTSIWPADGPPELPVPDVRAQEPPSPLAAKAAVADRAAGSAATVPAATVEPDPSALSAATAAEATPRPPYDPGPPPAYAPGPAGGTVVHDPHGAILEAAHAGRHSEAAAMAAAWEQEAFRSAGPDSPQALHWLEVRADLARLAGDPARACELWMAAATTRLGAGQPADQADVEGAVDRAHHQWQHVEDLLRARSLAAELVTLRTRVPGRRPGALGAIEARLATLRGARAN